MAIINDKPQNEAVLSNVGEIGEFRIRNSAKAFSILSSGLYANKVRAIIRELSCNAVDSHIAAGKQDTPFDVHLPNQLEPWFSIRDYGTGLAHDQVTNIYTTYFESTKTNSNEFIGALGLGSKSPFSYTDNFTVTAIKDGSKGIYTAFINEAGVPSIALMMTEETTEPSGVEVKFSVNDRYDFDKFKQEARSVYKYFKLQPVVTGSSGFQIDTVEYETKDIVPGVHSYKNGHRSVAIMGNIAYPVEIPQADQTLGNFRQLLNCGLEMHFGIGELDFQASREGLSYIPQTVNAIKTKLEALNAALAVVIAKEADAISNLWERADFLSKKKDSYLWASAVTKYCHDTKLVTFVEDKYGSWRGKQFQMFVKDLAKDYNIVITSFSHSRNSTTCSNSRTNSNHDLKDAKGNYIAREYWSLSVGSEVRFVINDTKIGATERAKYHWKNTPRDNNSHYTQHVMVLSAYDSSKPMNTKKFFDSIHNPAPQWIQNASALLEKPRKDSSVGKNVTIMMLGEKGYGGYYRQREMVWKDAGKAGSFDAKVTHYYLPLSGYVVDSAYNLSNVKEFHTDLQECGLATLSSKTVYGVRKGDIEFIKTQKNWINLEDYIAQELKTIDSKLMMSLVINAIDSINLMRYNDSIVDAVINPNSPYVKLVSQFEGHNKIKYSEMSLRRLCNRYAQGVNFSPEAFVQKFVDECATINKHYPLLPYLRSAPNLEVAAYINMVDTQKGI